MKCITSHSSSCHEKDSSQLSSQKSTQPTTTTKPQVPTIWESTQPTNITQAGLEAFWVIIVWLLQKVLLGFCAPIGTMALQSFSSYYSVQFPYDCAHTYYSMLLLGEISHIFYISYMFLGTYRNLINLIVFKDFFFAAFSFIFFLGQVNLHKGLLS